MKTQRVNSIESQSLVILMKLGEPWRDYFVASTRSFSLKSTHTTFMIGVRGAGNMDISFAKAALRNPGTKAVIVLFDPLGNNTTSALDHYAHYICESASPYEPLIQTKPIGNIAIKSTIADYIDQCEPYAFKQESNGVLEFTVYPHLWHEASYDKLTTCKHCNQRLWEAGELCAARRRKAG